MTIARNESLKRISVVLVQSADGCRLSRRSDTQPTGVEQIFTAGFTAEI